MHNLPCSGSFDDVSESLKTVCSNLRVKGKRGVGEQKVEIRLHPVVEHSLFVLAADQIPGVSGSGKVGAMFIPWCSSNEALGAMTKATGSSIVLKITLTNLGKNYIKK